MKKIDPALLALLSVNNAEEEQFLITEKEAEMLSRGELTFYNGRLYRTEKLIPQEVMIADLTIEGAPPLNLYGTNKEAPQPPVANNQLWTQEQYAHAFNLPMPANIERCKQFDVDEIKGVHLKSSRRSSETQEAVKSLIAVIENDPSYHPSIWVERANVLAAYAGEEAKPLLLEILNSTIPLKEGMKLESFSVKEFELKYLHTRPSLLEQATEELKLAETGYKPTINMIDALTHQNLGSLNPSAEDLIPRPVDTNQVLERSVYLTPGFDHVNFREMEQLLKAIYHDYGNDKLGTFQQFAECAGMLYGEYTGEVKMLDQNDPDPELTKWNYAIYLQKLYWGTFRGRTITILKLFNKFLNPDDKRYNLETPITGMRK